MFSKIINCLTHRQNVYLDSLSGMGLANYTRQLSAHLRQLPSTVVIDIYPHDSTFQNPQFIESLLLSKFTIEYPPSEVENISQLLRLLSTKSIKLIVILHKVQQYHHLLDYLDCLKSLYESSNFTTLITATTCTLPAHDLILSCQQFTFPGFITDFAKIVSELQESLDCHTTPDQRKNIYQLCLGHTALIKTLIQLFSNPCFCYDKNTLATHPVISARLDNLFRSFQPIDTNLERFFSDKPKLIKYGLSDGKIIGQLFTKYYQSQKQQQDITKLLTPIEKTIFHYLSSHSPEFCTVEQILSAVYPTVFTDKTDWSIYKHLNNLKHKLPATYRLDSRRSRGYRLSIPDHFRDTTSPLLSTCP